MLYNTCYSSTIATLVIQHLLKQSFKKTGIVLNDWKAQFDQAESEEAVLADWKRICDYFVQGAPVIVINQKLLISGAQPQAVIEQTIEEIAEE